MHSTEKVKLKVRLSLRFLLVKVKCTALRKWKWFSLRVLSSWMHITEKVKVIFSLRVLPNWMHSTKKVKVKSQLESFAKLNAQYWESESEISVWEFCQVKGTALRKWKWFSLRVLPSWMHSTEKVKVRSQFESFAKLNAQHWESESEISAWEFCQVECTALRKWKWDFSLRVLPSWMHITEKVRFSFFKLNAHHWESESEIQFESFANLNAQHWESKTKSETQFEIFVS